MDGRDVKVVLHQILLVICPLELVRNPTLSGARESYSWGGVLVGRGPLLWNFQREVPGGGAVGRQMLLGTGRYGSWAKGKLWVPWKPGARKYTHAAEAMCTARAKLETTCNTTGAWCWRSCTHIVGMYWASTPGRESRILSAILFPFHLLTKLNIMPATNGKIFKGPRSFFTEQEKRCIWS